MLESPTNLVHPVEILHFENHEELPGQGDHHDLEEELQVRLGPKHVVEATISTEANNILCAAINVRLGCGALTMDSRETAQ